MFCHRTTSLFRRYSPPRHSFRHMSLRRTFVAPITPPEKMGIELTEVESSICELLDGCQKYLKEEKGINTTCRVAGGWVRDKLLGSDSNDMDIALSDIMGLAFAEHLTAYAELKGIKLGHITKIEQNPDQSKHLETATLKAYGLDIDLVNLRSEEYAEGSRIPTGVAFGTPLEDALRRDITINALFYNVHTREVEDFTEKGLDDLRNGVIRTPLPPKETFLDDPLRVLRCVRFASRLGFVVIPEVKESSQDPIVQRALIEKVSRERVGDEVTKMLKGRDPLRSAQLISEFGLYHAVFSDIPVIAKSSLPAEFLEHTPGEALAAASILHALTSPGDSDLLQPNPVLTQVVQEDRSFRARLSLASLLLPLNGFTYVDNKKKTQSTVAVAIRESLKLGTQNHYLDGIPTLFSGIAVLKQGLKRHEEEPLSRASLGLLLRNKTIHNPLTGNHWTTSILFALVTDLVPFYNVQDDKFDIEETSRIVSRYNSFTDKILDLGLQSDIDSKPILNGNDVVVAFELGKPGPWVGKVLEDVVEWQLGNPSGSKEDAMLWLRSRGVNHYVSSDGSKAESPSKRTRRK